MKSRKPRKIAIIGGGISGLSCAYEILKLNPSAKITLYESSDRLGGSIQTTCANGAVLEHGADCFLSEKPEVRTLAKELGIESQLITTQPDFARSFVVRNGSLHPIPEGFHLLAPSRMRPFLKSRVLSWPGKLRAVCEPLVPRRRTQGDESLGSFVRRRFGPESLYYLAQPIVAGIYAADADKLSLEATFPKFLNWEDQSGSVFNGLRRSILANGMGDAVRLASGARYSLFQSFQNGVQTLTDALVNHLKERKVTLRLKTSVRSILRVPDTNGWKVQVGKTAIQFDAVCLAVPATKAAQLLGRFMEPAAILKTISSEPCLTLNLAFDKGTFPHPLEGFGMVIPQVERRPMLACTFSHRKFAGRCPDDQVLLRVFFGGQAARRLLHQDTADIIKTAMADLSGLLAKPAGAKLHLPTQALLTRYEEGLPQFHVGHVDRVRQFESMVSSTQGLAVCGNWLKGVGIPDCIASAKRAATSLFKQA